MKIYDAFLFFNELDLLEIRLNVLNEYVDYFVIAECELTFQNGVKEFVFEKNKERFVKFLDKIIYVKSYKEQVPQTLDHWGREQWQRNQLRRGLNNLNHDDIIILS